MAHEFIAKKGLISQGNAQVSGSLTVTNGITGSTSGLHYGNTIGSASYASTASYFITASVTSASYALSASWAPDNETYPASASWASSSISASYALNASSASYFLTSSVTSASYVPNLYPQVAQVTVPSASWVSASAFITTAQTASYVINALSASYFSPISSSNMLYLLCDDGNTYGVTLHKDGASIVLSVSQSAVIGTNGFLNVGAFNNPNSIKTVVNNYTASTSDYTLICNPTASIQIALPSISVTGSAYNMKNVSSYPVIVIPLAGLIDSQSYQTLSNRNSNLSIQWDGQLWWIL